MAQRPRRKKSNPEADAQRIIVRDLHRLIIPPYVLHHSPNEAGKASKVAQSILKGMGLHAGFSDLLVFGPDRRAAFLEVKAGKNQATPEQIAFGRDVWEFGWVWGVVRNTEDAVALLQRADIPLRLKGGL